MKMNEQFVTYDIALKLKELCFNEECLGFYHGRTFNEERFKRYLYENTISAPLWQQVIDWFRKSWKIHIEISHHENGWGSYLSIENTDKDRLTKLEQNSNKLFRAVFQRLNDIDDMLKPKLHPNRKKIGF